MIRLPSLALGRSRVQSPPSTEWRRGHEWPLQPSTTSVEQSNAEGLDQTIATCLESFAPERNASSSTLAHSGAACLEDIYDVDLHPFSEGGFGSVRRGRLRSDGASADLRAVKSVETWCCQAAKMVRREVTIHQMLAHPNICHLVESFETSHCVHLVLEYIDGKELFDYIQEKAFLGDGPFSKAVASQLFDALQYCHDLGVVHRDVKPENIMVSQLWPAVQVKLIDFGVSTFISEREEPVQGTYAYLAPEVRDGFTTARPALDMWSSGLVLHAMLLGGLPHNRERDGTAELDLSHKAYEFISTGAKLVLRGLLQVDSSMRLTAVQAASTAWATGVEEDDGFFIAEVISPEMTCSTNISSVVDFAESPRSTLEHDCEACSRSSTPA